MRPEAGKKKDKAFFELAERFRESNDQDQAKRLGDELGHFIFGGSMPEHRNVV